MSNGQAQSDAESSDYLVIPASIVYTSRKFQGKTAKGKKEYTTEALECTLALIGYESREITFLPCEDLRLNLKYIASKLEINPSKFQRAIETLQLNLLPTKDPKKWFFTEAETLAVGDAQVEVVKIRRSDCILIGIFRVAQTSLENSNITFNR